MISHVSAILLAAEMAGQYVHYSSGGTGEVWIDLIMYRFIGSATDHSMSSQSRANSALASPTTMGLSGELWKGKVCLVSLL